MIAGVGKVSLVFAWFAAPFIAPFIMSPSVSITLLAAGASIDSSGNMYIPLCGVVGCTVGAVFKCK